MFDARVDVDVPAMIDHCCCLTLGSPCPRRCLSVASSLLPLHLLSLFTRVPGAPEYSLYKINVGPDSPATINFNYGGIIRHLYKDNRQDRVTPWMASLRSN